MKRHIILIVLLFSGVLLQTTVFHSLPYNISPDISLIMLICFSFRYGSQTSQFSGFIAGLLEDLLSLSPLGFNSFIKTIIGFFTGIFHERLLMDPIVFPIISTAVVTLAKGLLSLLLIELFKIPLSAAKIFSNGFLIELLVNAFLAPLVFLLMRFILDRLLPDRKAL